MLGILKLVELNIVIKVFVVQLYVNDDFEGGETEFLYQNRREQAVAGDVLIFLQDLHIHIVVIHQ